MFKKLLIASNNPHKAEEIREVLSGMGNDPGIEVLTLKDMGIDIEVEEDGKTLEENSYKKAKEIFDAVRGSGYAAGMPVIADDTGLFVEALGGRPGVYSARYAGENASYEDNCNKLLRELKDVPDEKRTAEFRTVISLIINENESRLFEGVCRGRIISAGRGSNGFGYDPLFIPDGFDKTFAELTSEEKNKISHRAKALIKLKKFIEESCGK